MVRAPVASFVIARKTEVPLRAKVGETVRIFFGVGGPNKTSAFHVIGEIFDRVQALGSVTGEITPDVQTVNVAPGGAMIAELALEVPGQYVLVDHALSRVERGLAAILEVEGPADPISTSSCVPLQSPHRQEHQPPLRPA